MGTRKGQPWVAVVEDDADVRTAVKDLLTSNGLRARGYSSAEAFLQSALFGTAGCVVLDYRLPGMNGLELQRQLRTRGLNTPVIFVTSDPNISMVASADALAVLRKPFDPDELASLVKSALLQR
jgi:FixJ family two-component response regulator